MAQHKKSLQGIRVLDLTRILAGPWCTQNLADLGADVIKVERPGVGDDTRHWGPPFLKDCAGVETGEAAYYLSCNRGKRSLTVDISRKEGQNIIRRLAAQSDVVVENYKVGTLKRLGLGYEDLKSIRKGLIYCSISGYGQSGPLADKPGYDFVFQGLSGLMSINGEADGLPGAGPQRVGVPISDIVTGMYSTIAILAALAHKARSGEGQYIDMALLDCSVAMLAIPSMNYLTSGTVPRRQGNTHANIVPYQVFQCADGRLVVAVGNDSQFESFCAAIGRPDLSASERFSSNSRRLKNREVLVGEIEHTLLNRPVAIWIELLQKVNVPCGPVNDIQQAFQDSQVKHREVERSIPHPLAGMMKLIANPIRLSGTPIEYKLPPPLLGQHTSEILLSLLGIDEADQRRLQRAGTI